ncbi:hypothetical protein DL771_007121 [Monosporascus sp. 5C6A]|nr:hypothetical protein DL771_007121 [Monosporascus sp. 5C6A]
MDTGASVRGTTGLAPEGRTAETSADRNIAVICQIENTLAIGNLGAIANTSDVDELMLGAGDLRVTIGLPARTPPGMAEDPQFFAAVDKLITAGRKHDKAMMTMAFKTNAAGADWLTYGFNWTLLKPRNDQPVFHKHRIRMHDLAAHDVLLRINHGLAR